jgi:hypothetical protein
MLYTKNGQYPTTLPQRIVLSNGFTRTDNTTFTEEELADAGYIPVDAPPESINPGEVLEWTGSSWNVRNKTTEEIQIELDTAWNNVRTQRDQMLKDLDWRFIRNQSHTYLGIAPTDNLNDLNIYAQALRDITLQTDPNNIVWPVLSA